jgi:hypothetical protein
LLPDFQHGELVRHAQVGKFEAGLLAKGLHGGLRRQN